MVEVRGCFLKDFLRYIKKEGVKDPVPINVIPEQEVDILKEEYLEVIKAANEKRDDLTEEEY